MKQKTNLSILLIIIILAVGLIVFGCTKQSEDEKEVEKSSTIFGNVIMESGNCMPGTVGEQQGGEPCRTEPINATLYITKPKDTYKSELFVEKVTANESGNFETGLSPGNYSLFIYDNFEGWEEINFCDGTTFCDEGGAYTCQRTICFNETTECACNFFKVEKGESKEINLTLDRAAR